LLLERTASEICTVLKKAFSGLQEGCLFCLKAALTEALQEYYAAVPLQRYGYLWTLPFHSLAATAAIGQRMLLLPVYTVSDLFMHAMHLSGCCVQHTSTNDSRYS
jgi:hypothetical protein